MEERRDLLGYLCCRDSNNGIKNTLATSQGVYVDDAVRHRDFSGAGVDPSGRSGPGGRVRSPECGQSSIFWLALRFSSILWKCGRIKTKPTYQFLFLSLIAGGLSATISAMQYHLLAGLLG